MKKVATLAVLMLLWGTAHSQDRYCNGQVKSGPYLRYWPNGAKVNDAYFTYYPSGQKARGPHGLLYYPNNQVINAPYVSYYPNGQKTHDAYVSYYPNGQPIRNQYTFFHPNGQPTRTPPRQIKHREGNWVFFFSLDPQGRPIVTSFSASAIFDDYTLFFTFVNGEIGEIEADCQ